MNLGCDLFIVIVHQLSQNGCRNLWQLLESCRLSPLLYMLCWGRVTVWFVKSMSDFVGGSICRRPALARLAFYSVPWPECFFPMHLLPLRQVSFCRDSLSSTRGDTQGADSPRSCGDSGFVSSGCLALSSYPLRVGGAVTATPGAAGWEAVGRAKGGGWRTGTEPLIPLFSFPILTGRHRNYKKQTPDTHQTEHTSIFMLKQMQQSQITSPTPT